MSRNYKFHNLEGLYFISFAVVGWLDVFIRNEYKEIFKSVYSAVKNKKLLIQVKVYAKFAQPSSASILRYLLKKTLN